MALIHRAELRPTKLELLADRLPGRPWWQGPLSALTRVAACRFDDPAGEVGVETLIVRAGDGPPLHVPLTYRGAPLDGGATHLIGTLEHSVLGRRWVYDACGDPVYAAAVTHAIVTGGGEAEEFVEGDPGSRAPSMTVRGSGRPGPDDVARAATAVIRVDDGDPTVVVTDVGELIVHRVVPGAPGPVLNGPVLTGLWPGQPSPVPLAAWHGR